MSKIDELRKQVAELEAAACVLLRVFGKGAKIVSHKNLDKGRQAYQDGEKYSIPAVPLIEYEEAMNICVMCKIRSTLKRAMDEIDALPEINSALYDDTVCEAYQALETAYYMHQHYCEEVE